MIMAADATKEIQFEIGHVLFIDIVGLKGCIRALTLGVRKPSVLLHLCKQPSPKQKAVPPRR